MTHRGDASPIAQVASNDLELLNRPAKVPGCALGHIAVRRAVKAKAADAIGTVKAIRDGVQVGGRSIVWWNAVSKTPTCGTWGSRAIIASMPWMFAGCVGAPG